MVMLKFAGANKLPTSKTLTQNNPGPKVPVVCGAAAVTPAVTFVVAEQSMPEGWPIPSPSCTVGGTPAPLTLFRVTLTVPLAAMLNVKNLNPPTGSVPVKDSLTVGADPEGVLVLLVAVGDVDVEL